MSLVVCPTCNGSKQLFLLCVSYTKTLSQKRTGEISCFVCNGTGSISSDQLQRSEKGAKFRNYRESTLNLGLREAAELWGMSPSVLSAIELGLLVSEWTPPGWKEGSEKMNNEFENTFDESEMVTCERCGRLNHFEDFGSLGACDGNMFCPYCESEVDRFGRMQTLCGTCDTCKTLMIEGTFAKCQERRIELIKEKREIK